MGLTRIRNRAIGTDIATGAIVQVKQTTFTGTNTYATTANTDATITDLSVVITPKYSNSLIKIEALVTGEWSTGAQAATNSTWFFYRDSTKLSHAAAGVRNVGILMGGFLSYYDLDFDSTPETAMYFYFDSPSTTSQITYKVGVNNYYGYTWNLNRTAGDTDNTQYERGLSTIAVSEIKA